MYKEINGFSMAEEFEHQLFEHNLQEAAWKLETAYNLHKGGKITQEEVLAEVRTQYKALKKSAKN